MDVFGVSCVLVVVAKDDVCSDLAMLANTSSSVELDPVVTRKTCFAGKVTTNGRITRCIYSWFLLRFNFVINLTSCDGTRDLCILSVF